MNILGKGISYYQVAARHLSNYLDSIALLLARFIVARIFLSSGLTKWVGPFQFNTDKYDLFLYEFFCPDPPVPGALQLCNAETLDYVEGSFMVRFVEILAVSTGIFEVVLPLLLILGLLSRFAALGLLVMTLFIQLAVFPTWEHWWNPAAWWAMVLLLIVAKGPGKWSLDQLFHIDHTSTDRA